MCVLHPIGELHSLSLSLMVTFGLGGRILTKKTASPLIVNISSPSRMKSSSIAKLTTDDVTLFT